VYHIQVLLANELDYYKGKGRETVDQHIQTLQNAHKVSQNELLTYL